MSITIQPSVALNRPNPFSALFQEIAEIACQSLRRSSYMELREVRCDFSGGVLVLQGSVPSYHLKQLAQASVAEVPGVVEVDNRIEVVLPSVRRDRAEYDETIAARPR